MRPAPRSTTPAPATSTRSSRPASRRATCPTSPACRARARCSSGTRTARSSRSTSSTTRRTSDHPGRLVALGKAPDGKIVGVFIKAAVKGLIWYNPKVYDEATSARRPGTSSTPTAKAQRPATPRSGASASSPARDPAGRARTGSRTSSSASPAPTSTTAGWRARRSGSSPEIKTAFQAFGDVVAERVSAAREYRRRDQLRQGRRPAVHDTARLPAPPPGQLHHRLLQEARRSAKAGPTTTSSRSPTSTRQFAGAVEGAGDLFGMFHDTPAGQVADQVPRDPAGPGDLGQASAARCPPTRTCRSSLPGRHLQAVGRRSWPTPRSSCSTRRT